MRHIIIYCLRRLPPFVKSLSCGENSCVESVLGIGEGGGGGGAKASSELKSEL